MEPQSLLQAYGLMQHSWCPTRKFSWLSLSAYKFGCMDNQFSKLVTKAEINLCLDWQAFKDCGFFPVSFSLHFKWKIKTSLANTLWNDPFHLTWYRIAPFRRWGQKRWNAKLKEQSCGGVLCLRTIFVLTCEQSSKCESCLLAFSSPPLRLELNYLTS